MKLAELSSVFEVRYGHSLELNRLTQISLADGGVPFVSRKMGDNGVAAFVRPIPDVVPAAGGSLSCALSGNGVLSTFVQDRPFYTAFHVAILEPKIEMSKSQLLYYCLCIVANRYRYSFGRQANRTIKSLLIPDPSCMPGWIGLSNSHPDMFNGCDAPASKHQNPALASMAWRPFELGSLFDLRKGRRLTKAKMKLGNVPFIGAIDSNNGVSHFVEASIHDANTISVNYNGAGVAEAFYQPAPFWASDDVNVLYPRFEMTPEIALFIAAIIRREKYRFSYGRKWHLERMRASKIFLPVDLDGNPDWMSMRIYINALPFSSQISGKASEMATADEKGDSI